MWLLIIDGNPFYYVLAVVILIFSAIIHECAHAWVALKCGDDTAYRMGRITLNPVVHIDPIMTIIVPILTLATMGFAFGGAKPVPIMVHALRHPRRDLMLTAAAGPVSNLLLALVGFLLAFVLRSALPPGSGDFAKVVHTAVLQLVFINVLLLGFNLLPIPPLDGSRILRYFLPEEMGEMLDRMEQFGLIILMVVLSLGLHRVVIGPLFELTSRILQFIYQS